MKGAKTAGDIAAHLHDHTYGIASDPLAGTSIVFSALIHDIDHRGVSNAQLSTENPDMASKFSNKSVAEQNSVTMAWDILMEERFKNLRSLMFETEEDLMHFRQLVVNMVLATDIFDRELSALRKSRWAAAFSGEEQFAGDADQQRDTRATVVLEHIIQASDVSHTMQHWHVYCKWNSKLFQEMHKAYKEGRMAKDPATFW